MQTEKILSRHQIDEPKLKNWITAYKLSIANEINETSSCIFHLAVLESFIKEIHDHNNDPDKEKIDAVRIYLVRSGEIMASDKLPAQTLSDGKTVQLGFVIVPAKKFEIKAPHLLSAKDCLDDNELNWIVPGYSNETSGLCPVNCPNL